MSKIDHALATAKHSNNMKEKNEHGNVSNCSSPWGTGIAEEGAQGSRVVVSAGGGLQRIQEAGDSCAPLNTPDC
jgi:hypothetical protein